MTDTTTTVIDVPEVHCNHCVESIEGALSVLTGVNDATVSLEDTNVTVEHTDAVSRDELVNVIEEQGYEVPAS
jgi:copper chaperone